MKRSIHQKAMEFQTISFLEELQSTNPPSIDRFDYKKALKLLSSHGKLDQSELKKLLETFDKRDNRDAFYDAVNTVKHLAGVLSHELTIHGGPYRNSASFPGEVVCHCICFINQSMDVLAVLRWVSDSVSVSKSYIPGGELLVAWGYASMAALEAMWRSRRLWRTLHHVHDSAIRSFFREIQNVPQRPDIRVARTALSCEIDSLPVPL